MRARRAIRGISPVLATLILIIVALVAGVLVWAWLSGWISLQMAGMGEALKIDSVSVINGHVRVKVRNTGSVKAVIRWASVDDGPIQEIRVPVDVGGTGYVDIPYAWTYKTQYKIWLRTERGTVLEGAYPVYSPRTPYCLKFDGEDDYAMLPDPMNGFPRGSITLEAWVKGYGVVFDEQGSGAPSSTRHDAHVEVLSDGTVMMGVWGYGGDYAVKLDCGKIDTGRWNHLVMVYDDTAGELRGYVNGELKNSATGVSRNAGDATTYVIGHGDSTNLGEGKFFCGFIDEVRIYNRALSHEEVMNNYKGFVTQSGLVCWHTLDATWDDASDYNNDLTTSGTSWYTPGVTQETVSGSVALVLMAVPREHL